MKGLFPGCSASEGDAFGYLPLDRGLDDEGVDAALVGLIGGDTEVVQVRVGCVLLVQGEESVLHGAFDGGLPSLCEQYGLCFLAELGLPESF